MKKKKEGRLLIIQTLVVIGVFSLSFIWGGLSSKFEISNPRGEDTPVHIGISNIFPVGVDPLTKTIVENPEADEYYQTFVSADNPRLSVRKEWWRKAVDKVALMPWYQSLASASSRTLVIYAGERKEQVAENFAIILNWDTEEKDAFVQIIEDDNPSMTEGKFYPGRYVVPVNASPTEVAEHIYLRFQDNVLEHYVASVDEKVKLSDALIIASLLEREAYDFNDMRYISGVIWNRLFIDMRLQIDATLQYARADASGGKWWPVPKPRDKKLNSPFNTYAHHGLPPHPIANPSAEAILAALNPRKTDCLYYVHDDSGAFFCSKTYEEHQALIKKLF